MEKCGYKLDFPSKIIISCHTNLRINIQHQGKFIILKNEFKEKLHVNIKEVRGVLFTLLNIVLEKLLKEKSLF